jgi:hypothetical protein
MADYYPLLARAVAGLKTSTPDARKAIYERARKALLGQLNAMQPPPPDGAIEREAQALDEAVARLEREFSLTAGAPAFAPPPAKPHQDNARQDKPREEKPRDDLAPKDKSPTTSGPDPYPGDETEGADESFREEAPLRDHLRPAAPKPINTEGGGLRRLAIILGALTLVGLLVGFAAWKLRDRPEDLAKLSPPQEKADQNAGSKIGERIGGEPAQGAAQTGAGAPTLPIAYRSAILTRDASEPGGVKTYVGTVVWRRDSINRGPNQQLVSAIRAEVEIPDAKFRASLVIEKNFDPSLSFSHTINVRFFPGEGSPIGNVTAIGMPEMRRDEAPKGVALIGLPVEIAPNAFLAGLNQASAEQNGALLANPTWLDIQLSVANGSIAKITMEKGAAGEKIFSDVFAEWKAK